MHQEHGCEGRHLIIVVDDDDSVILQACGLSEREAVTLCAQVSQQLYDVLREEQAKRN